MGLARGDAALADEVEDRGDEEDGRDDDGDDDGDGAALAVAPTRVRLLLGELRTRLGALRTRQELFNR